MHPKCLQLKQGEFTLINTLMHQLSHHLSNLNIFQYTIELLFTEND